MLLRRFEPSKRLPDAIAEDLGGGICGIDNDRTTVARHVELRRNVVAGDPTDLDFWDRISREGTVKVAMLALPNHQANLAAEACQGYAHLVRKLLQGSRRPGPTPARPQPQ